MWCEIQFVVFNRKVPICGPYLFHLISKSWAKLYPNDEFVAPGWIRHEPIKLHIKSQWDNTTTEAEAAKMAVDEDEIEEEEAAEDHSAGYTPPSAEPSWVKKLNIKMNRLFCMQT